MRPLQVSERARAEEAGLPYQTLTASVLHMVARGGESVPVARGVIDG